MIETVVSMGLAVDEAMEIRKNHLAPKVLTGKEKRICIVTGTHGCVSGDKSTRCGLYDKRCSNV